MDTDRDNSRITNAIVEWDDPHAFRVYLVCGDDFDRAIPMRGGASYYQPGSVEERLYFAACVKEPAAMISQIMQHVAGWPKKGPAEKVARAVVRELRRIAKGEPAHTQREALDAMRLAAMMGKGRR